MASTDLTLPIQQNSLPVGSIETYISWAQRFPFLTASQERELATKYQQDGDLKAAQQLVLSHLRLVIHIAKKYSGYGLAYADLIQEGSVGLMKAVKHFDPKVGVRLVSFAIHWIKAEIHEFILRNYRIVKVATTKAQRKLFFNLRKMTRQMLDSQQTTMEKVATIAKNLNVKHEDVETMQQRLNGQDLSLESQSQDDDATPNPLYFLAAPTSTEPTAILESEDNRENSKNALASALKELDARSRDIVMARWLGNKKVTLSALAKKYSVSLERIRQIEAGAFKKMREAISNCQN